MTTTVSRWLLRATALVVLFGLPPRAQARDADIDARALETKIDQIHHNYQIAHSPGAMVTVISNGVPVFQKGYGLANREWSVPWTDRVRYTFFSTTKSMVALAFLKLEDQGKLRLDDAIYKYLDGFPHFQYDITIRQLLNHTSGLWQDEALALISGLNASEYQIRLDELYDLMNKQTRLPYRPGSNFFYNDGGMRLAARILSKVTGKSFGDALKTLVFEPAGMNTADTKLTEPEYFLEEATAYDISSRHQDALATGSVKVASGLYENSGDGAGVGTMRDYVAYVRLLSGRQDGIKWIDRLTRPTILRPGYISPYRLGFIEASHRGITVDLHGGYMGKKIAYLRDLDLWIIVMRNALDYDDATDGQRLEAIVDAVLASSTRGRWYLSAGNLKRDATLSRPGNEKYTADEVRLLSGRFQEQQSGMVITLTQQTDGGIMRISAEYLGKRSYITRTAGSGGRYHSYANGNNASPDPLSLEARTGELLLTYSDWEAPRRLQRLVPEASVQWPEIEGLYRSPELGMFYQVKLKDGAAWLLVGPGNREEDRFRLSPISADTVLATPAADKTSRDPMQVRFVRSAGRITGAILDTVNVKQLRLIRARLVDE